MDVVQILVWAHSTVMMLRKIYPTTCHEGPERGVELCALKFSLQRNLVSPFGQTATSDQLQNII